MPKDEKNGVKSLDFEIQMVKVLKFADKFDRAMKKNIKNDLKKAAILLEKTNSEKLQLENRVRLLSTQALDADMLDEAARNELGLIEKEEYVIFD